MHYFVVAQGLEYLRATARVLTVYFAPSRLELTPFSLLRVCGRKMRYFVVAQGLEYLRADITTPRSHALRTKTAKKDLPFLLLTCDTISQILFIWRSRGLDVITTTPMRPPTSRQLKANLKNHLLFI